MELTLVRRRELSSNNGTVGMMQAGTLTYYTMERPWLNNAIGQSCVPVGRYKLVPHVSPRFGKVRSLINLELGIAEYPTSGIPRSLILIHPANLSSELAGCIAPGKRFGTLKKNGIDLPAVLESQSAVTELFSVLGPSEVHWLTISWNANEAPDFSNVQSSVTSTAPPAGVAKPE